MATSTCIPAHSNASQSRWMPPALLLLPSIALLFSFAVVPAWAFSSLRIGAEISGTSAGCRPRQYRHRHRKRNSRLAFVADVFTSRLAQASTSADSTIAATSARSSRGGTNADADVAPPPSDWREQALSQLSNVIDPDLNADIVTLKFVKNLTLEVETSTVAFDLELTTPACPVKDMFVEQCHDLLTALPFVSDTRITLTAQPTVGETTSEVGMTRVSSIVAVSSCKGGVGKSTTAVNLAYALRKLGARVGIFDVDLYGPSLPTMVTPDDDTVRFAGRQIKPLERDGVKLMSFGYVNDGAAVMRGPMVSQLLDQLLNVVDWGELDYLVLDMPPGTGDVQLTLSQRLNLTAAVIVTTPQELSFADVVRGIDMFDSVEVPCVAVVENMAYYEVDKKSADGGAALQGDNLDLESIGREFRNKLSSAAGRARDGLGLSVDELAADLVNVVAREVETSRKQGRQQSEEGEKEQVRIFGEGHKTRLANQYGIEHTFSVPLLDGIAKSGDSGEPFLLSYPDGPQAKVFQELASAVVSEVAKTKFGEGKGNGALTVQFDEANGVLRISQGGEEGSSSSETLPPAELRRECRCAACVEELTGKQILQKEAVSDLVRPTRLAPCGNYALSVDWSDGHRSLYPYRQIRSILRGEKKNGEGAMPL